MISLNVQKVTKNYGKTVAVRDMSFVLQPGVYGIIGPNGAGKSTLFQMITTNLTQYEGTISYCGDEIKKMGSTYRNILGYMPQITTGYGDFTAKQFLYYMAALKGIKKEEAEQKIKALSSILNLDTYLNRKIKAYSGGMKQRLFFLQALLNDPKVLVLDEPTAGLDPLERIRLRNYISTIAKEILFIKEGNLLFEGSITELIERLKGRVQETLIAEDVWEEFQRTHKITRSLRLDTVFHVRYIVDEVGESSVLPSLEDAYLYYMG